MARPQPTLASLGLAPPPGAPADAPVRGLTADSREVRDGWVFFALEGGRLNGAEFASYAFRQGALAAVCSAEGARTIRRLWDRPEPPAERLPLIVTEAPRRTLALAAARWHDAQPEVMAAITGTNGKTSVASFLRQIWTALGRAAVNIGTTGVEGAVSAPGTLTTPEPLTLHALLADLAEAGVARAAMEASSHGLAQHRLDGVRLRAAGLTNVTRDHMDYHATHDAYVAAKLRLFSEVLPAGGAAALNADDPVFARAAALVRGRGGRVIAVGRAEGADLRMLSAAFHETGQRLRFAYAGTEHAADLALIGGFQGENALLAAALAIGCDEDPAAVFAALPRLVAVRGRMEHVATRANGARIYVDYAHTPEALAAALAALRLHAPGALSVVFGAGGDRDPGKRPLMGEAARAADAVVVTDDNPRTEDAAAIRAQVLRGLASTRRTVEEIGDRAEAILMAIDDLGPGDRLLIAGKGHETVQIVGETVMPFDDADQARAAVAALDGMEADDGLDDDWDGEDDRT